MDVSLADTVNTIRRIDINQHTAIANIVRVLYRRRFRQLIWLTNAHKDNEIIARTTLVDIERIMQ